MNAVLYGVDARAAERDRGADGARSARERILERCGNALTSQSVGPKILWLKKNRPRSSPRPRRSSRRPPISCSKLTGECVIDHYIGGEFIAALSCRRAGLERRARARHHRARAAAEAAVVDRHRRPGDRAAARGHRARRRHAGHRRHHRRGRGGAERRRRRGRRHDADVRLDHLHHHAVDSGRVRRCAALVCAVAVSGRARLDGRARDQRHADPLVPRRCVARELDRPTARLPRSPRRPRRSPPGARGLVMLPYFSGERTPIHDPHAKGVHLRPQPDP